jgi:hypothetical protein
MQKLGELNKEFVSRNKSSRVNFHVELLKSESAVDLWGSLNVTGLSVGADLIHCMEEVKKFWFELHMSLAKNQSWKLEFVN